MKYIDYASSVNGLWDPVTEDHATLSISVDLIVSMLNTVSSMIKENPSQKGNGFILGSGPDVSFLHTLGQLYQWVATLIHHHQQ